MTKKKHKKRRKKRSPRGAARTQAKGSEPARRDVSLDELQSIVARAAAVLSEDDIEKLSAAVDTLAVLTRELEAKGASIRRLRKMIFGAKTEKTSAVIGGTEQHSEAASEPVPAEAADDEAVDDDEPKPKPKRKGHGRNGAASYRGANKETASHASLQHKDPCPEPGCDGKVYVQAQPKVLVRVAGMAPLQATVWELERLRCNLCGKIFTAEAPEDVGSEKYDASSSTMIGMLRYGSGLPFNRLQRLEQSLGIPLPASTQWEVVRDAAELLEPVFEELIRQGAQGRVLHNDDTTMKILGLDEELREQVAQGDGAGERSGVFTTGIVSTAATGDDGHPVALFFTGNQHAGENLADVLARRAAELETPIQMCDGLSHNTAGDFESIVANCIAHSRRKFVEVADNFPDECSYVLETLRDVYRNEATARKEQMSPDDRLRFHQENSGPLMSKLDKWLREQLEHKKVEPNSTLGEAIGYTRRHWTELTRFLHTPGAPLDNNVAERALKKAIMHRKNSLFYKSKNGARVGDLFMSLIHTAELNDVNPFDYLVTLQQRYETVAADPAAWMPWNYHNTPARTTDDE